MRPPTSTNLGWAPNSSPHPCYGQAQWADLITNLGLVYQPKPKSKANRGGLKNPSQTQAQNFIFLQLASPSALGFSTITTSSRRQRRRHHVGKNARERQPTPVLFPARPRTPTPSQSRRCRAREPRSSGGPGSQRVSNVLLF